MAKVDFEILEAALIGFQQKRNEIDARIADIQRLVGNRGRAALPETGSAPIKRRKLSAAARKRIAEAQKKRWAKFHKERA